MLIHNNIQKHPKSETHNTPARRASLPHTTEPEHPANPHRLRPTHSPKNVCHRRVRTLHHRSTALAETRHPKYS